MKGRGGAKKLRNTFQRHRPEEFSSGDSAEDFGLRSNILRIGMKRKRVKGHLL